MYNQTLYHISPIFCFLKISLTTGIDKEQQLLEAGYLFSLGIKNWAYKTSPYFI